MLRCYHHRLISKTWPSLLSRISLCHSHSAITSQHTLNTGCTIGYDAAFVMFSSTCDACCLIWFCTNSRGSICCRLRRQNAPHTLLSRKAMPHIWQFWRMKYIASHYYVGDFSPTLMLYCLIYVKQKKLNNKYFKI